MTESNHSPSGATAPLVANPSTSFSLDQYYREKLDNVRCNLPEAARQLRAAGVARVHVDYDGCGDSGQIEGVAYVDAAGESINPAGQVTMTEDQLMDLFYDLTQARHPGWENDDGAYGEFDWDLETDALSHTHNDRFTDYYTTEHEGL